MNKLFLLGLSFLIVMMISCAPTQEPAQTTPPPVQQAPPPPPPVVEEVVENPTPPPPPPEEEVQAQTSSTVKEFDMIAKRFVFQPEVITVNEGDTVLLHITSTDVAHGIALPEFGVRKSLPAGKEVDIEFVADTKGEFGFRCSVFCGSGHGSMVGKLVVQ